MQAVPKVLDGYQIVSIALNVPGPVAIAQLRSHGAAVVKVEPPAGDPLRQYAGDWYRDLHHGIQVEQLDLKAPVGQDRLHMLLAQADVLVTSSRPAALARLGLDWAILQQRYQSLCQVDIIGHAPPHAEQAGHDLTYQAAAGLVGPPNLPRSLLADLAGAERVVQAVFMLLLWRERGQGGNRVEVVLEQAAHSFAAPLHYGLTAPGGLLGGGYAGYRLYQTSDGWIALAALEPHFATRLMTLLSIPGLDAAYLEPRFRERSTAVWEAFAAHHDLPLVACTEPL